MTTGDKTPSAATESGDHRLLADYAAGNAAAFTTLVERHTPFVHAACRRQLGRPDLAEDAAQGVFIILARKAGGIRESVPLAAWLHRVAGFVCRGLLAEERARSRREKEAAAMTSPMEPFPALSEAERTELTRVMDREIEALPERCRRAVTLHYLAGQSQRVVGAALGTTEEGARKLIARGLEKLRGRFARRGFPLLTGAVGAFLLAEGASAAPAALGAKIAAALVVSKTAAPTAAWMAAQGGLHMMLWTKIKTVFVSGLAAAGLAVGVGVAAISWDANPFAGTKVIVVQHGSDSYRVDDPKQVRELLDSLVIEQVKNGNFLLSQSTAAVTFERGEKDFYRVQLSPDGAFMIPSGTMYVHSNFIKTLNGVISVKAGKSVDLLQFNLAAALPEFSPERLSAGLSRAVFRYHVGDGEHELRVTDPARLREIHAVLKLGAKRPLARSERHLETCEFEFAIPGSRPFRGWFIKPGDIGTFTGDVVYAVDTAFADRLSAMASDVEKQPIDLLGVNSVRAEETARAKEAALLLGGITNLVITSDRNGKDARLPVDGKDLQKILTAFAPVRALPQSSPAAAKGLKVKAVLKSGRAVDVAFLESDELSVRPISSSPIEISGFGQVWVNDQWQYRFERCLFNAERAEKDARFQKTAQELMKDFPKFLAEVQWMEFHDAVGKEYFMQSVTDRTVVRDVLALLTVESYKSDPDAGRKEKLDRRPALMLVPGTGFTLPLIFTDNRNAMVPGCGTLTFRQDVLPHLRKKISMPKVSPEDTGRMIVRRATPEK
ncbi:MAG: sigma-70 family RNA polymerase sigma factor [Planctomycetota bacterium]